MLQLSTLNDKTIRFQIEKKIPVSIVFSAQEIEDENREAIIKKKIEAMENVFSTHGMILRNHYKIIKMPLFEYNNTNFQCTFDGTVWLSASIYLPKQNSVIVGARVIKKDPIEGVFLVYRKTEILISKILISDEDYDLLEIDNFYAIVCLSVIPTLGSANCAIQAKLLKIFDIPLHNRYLSYSIADNINIQVSESKMLYTNSNIEELANFYKSFDEYKVNFDQLYKKLINPYELVYGNKYYSPKNFNQGELYSGYPAKISAPVSRAYFKVLEMIIFFKLIKPENSYSFLTLGDAPGGFAQCLSQQYENCTVATVSLLDKSAIQYHNAVKNDKKVTIDGLADGTGDLLSLENVKFIHNKYKDLDFVGCDGAIAYENKETDHIPLLLSEVICALGVLKKGGSAIFKLYRMWHKVTVDIYLLLMKFFKKVLVYKARSSRIASLETFYIGVDFLGISDTEMTQLYDIFPMKNLSSIIDYKDYSMISGNIIKFNTYYDNLVYFLHRLILEYYHYEGNNIDREWYYKNQIEYAKKFFKK